MPQRRVVAGLIRLSPAGNILQGFSSTARRYVREADFTAAEAGRAVETFSNRHFDQLRNALEFGAPMTKEARTKRLKAHPLEYRSAKTREAVRYQKRAKSIRAMVPGVTPKDAKLIDLKNSMTRAAWLRNATERDRKRFRDLFDRYPRDQVLEALGSPPTR